MTSNSEKTSGVGLNVLSTQGQGYCLQALQSATIL